MAIAMPHYNKIAVASPGRILARSVLTLKAKDSGGVLLDRSAYRHSVQHGSLVGADSNDPVWLQYLASQYAYFPGALGNSAATPDASPLDITGDIDIRADVAADNWSATTQTLLAKYLGTGDQRSWLFSSSNGLLRFQPSSLGTSASTLTTINSTVAHGIPNGERRSLRMTWRQSDGRTQFFTAPAGDLTNWTQLGANVTAAVSALFNSSTSLEVGSSNSGGERFTGKIYRAQVYAGLDGTDLRFDADFTDATRVNPASTSFTEKSSNNAIVTLNRPTTGRKITIVDRDLYLFGADDFVQIADHSLLNFLANQSFTVSWLGRLAGTTANQVLIAKKTGLSSDVGWSIDRGTANAARGIIADGTIGPSAVGGAISQGVMTLVSLVRDVTSDTVRVYINGVPGVAVTDTTTGSLSNTQAIRIGALSASTAGADFALAAVNIIREPLSSTADFTRLMQELLS